MKQYKITYNVETETADDCFLHPDDPINTIKENQFFGKLVNFEVEENNIQTLEDKK